MIQFSKNYLKPSFLFPTYLEATKINGLQKGKNPNPFPPDWLPWLAPRPYWHYGRSLGQGSSLSPGGGRPGLTGRGRFSGPARRQALDLGLGRLFGGLGLGPGPGFLELLAPESPGLPLPPEFLRRDDLDRGAFRRHTGQDPAAGPVDRHPLGCLPISIIETGNPPGPGPMADRAPGPITLLRGLGPGRPGLALGRRNGKYFFHLSLLSPPGWIFRLTAEPDGVGCQPLIP